jgi:EmrB/QacA subfamily drug resistance transporter
LDGQTEKRSALIVAMLSSFFAPFMASSINVALPSIADEFEMDAVLLTWVATSYLLSAAVFMVPFGKLADIHGRKRIFILGMWVFGIASVLCAIAPSSWILIGARIIQGFGSAMVFGTSIALLTSVYPPQERGKVLGLTVAVTYVGLSVGPSLGGFLTGFLGWRSLFMFTLPFAAAVIIVASRRLKGEWADAKGETFDLGGSVIYALSLTGVILGFSFLPDLLGVTISLAGVAGMGVFVYWESRFRNPVLDMALFRRNKAFAFSNMAALINYSATFAVTFLMSLYLQYVKDLTPEEAGLLLVAQPIVMAAFSPLAGRLSDVVEPRIISSIGMAISAVGLVLLSFMAEDTSIWVIIASLAVLGFGFALFSSPNMNAIMSSVEKKSYGVASSTVGTMRLVGQVLSMGIATLFISLYIGSTDLTHELAPEFLKSFQLSFTLFAAMCFVGVFASLARGKIRRDSHSGL